MRWIIALILYGLASLQAVRSEEIDLTIGTHKIRAAIANTPKSRAQGLMNKTFLCANCGMLFIFPQPGNYKFWMKNTPLPLAIAFIAADGRIVQISEMQANTLHTHHAQTEILYALEMNYGWFRINSIKSNSYIINPHLLPAAE